MKRVSMQAGFTLIEMMVVREGIGGATKPADLNPEFRALGPGLERGAAILSARSAAWRTASTQLRRIEAAGELAGSLDAIAASSGGKVLWRELAEGT